MRRPGPRLPRERRGRAVVGLRRAAAGTWRNPADATDLDSVSLWGFESLRPHQEPF